MTKIKLCTHKIKSQPPFSIASRVYCGSMWTENEAVLLHKHLSTKEVFSRLAFRKHKETRNLPCS